MGGLEPEGHPFPLFALSVSNAQGLALVEVRALRPGCCLASTRLLTAALGTTAATCTLGSSSRSSTAACVFWLASLAWPDRSHASIPGSGWHSLRGP